LVGNLGLAANSVGMVLSGAAHPASLGSPTGFLSAVLLCRLSMIGSLLRVAYLDPSAAGYCILRGGQITAAMLGFLGLLFVCSFSHGGAYYVLWVVTLSLDAVSLRSLSCCNALLYSKYVPLNVGRLSDRVSHVVLASCAMIALVCFSSGTVLPPPPPASAFCKPPPRAGTCRLLRRSPLCHPSPCPPAAPEST
jgi:hypothetical protein